MTTTLINILLTFGCVILTPIVLGIICPILFCVAFNILCFCIELFDNIGEMFIKIRNKFKKDKKDKED